MKKLKVLDLFSGIGGFSLGLERAGMKTVAFCEIDPFCREVLVHHWPTSEIHDDVRSFHPDAHVRVICGGFPCQPVSLAGRRRGASDERWLWPEFARLIRLLRPRYALMENVPGHLSMGFGRVCGDLAEIGYDAEWDCVPAAAVHAPHRRDRVFIVAESADAASERRTGEVVSRPDVERHGLQPAQLRQALPDADRQELRLEPIAVGRRIGTAVAGDDGRTGPTRPAAPPWFVP